MAIVAAFQCIGIKIQASYIENTIRIFSKLEGEKLANFCNNFALLGKRITPGRLAMQQVNYISKNLQQLPAPLNRTESSFSMQGPNFLSLHNNSFAAKGSAIAKFPKLKAVNSKLFRQSSSMVKIQNNYYSVVVAVASKSLGIGSGGSLPWRFPNELKLFKKITVQKKSSTQECQNVIIFGNNTFRDDLQERLLPDRRTIVLSRNQKASSEADIRGQVNPLYANSLQSAIDLSYQLHQGKGQTFVVGGEEVYKQALKDQHCSAIHMTKVDLDVECNKFFPNVMDKQFCMENEYENFVLWSSSQPTYEINKKKYESDEDNKTNKRYLDMSNNIIMHGAQRGDRTGTGTYSMFGQQMRFCLRHSFPLLTTKRVFWKGVVEELLWFVRGCTDSKKLSQKGVKIWDANGSQEFLQKRNLQYREGDLGPVYGFQWRNFGAEYQDCEADYTDKGVDQLKEVIHLIKNEPTSRRIIISAWNPADLHKMALPPCHLLAQFYVDHGELSCHLYQRSADMGLGVPFNIASYALLTEILAAKCGLKAGDFVHTIGDAHVYSNHVDALQKQCQNQPRAFPTLKIVNYDKDTDKLEDLSLSNFELQGYEPHKTIKMDMAV